MAGKGVSSSLNIFQLRVGMRLLQTICNCSIVCSNQCVRRLRANNIRQTIRLFFFRISTEWF